MFRILHAFVTIAFINQIILHLFLVERFFLGKWLFLLRLIDLFLFPHGKCLLGFETILIIVVRILLNFCHLFCGVNSFSIYGPVNKILLVVKVEKFLRILVTKLNGLRKQQTYFFCINLSASIISSRLSIIKGCFPLKLLN